MKVQSFLKPALIGLVCFGLVVPQTVSAGLLPAPQSIRAKSKVKTVRIPDVVLNKEGTFRGVIVDSKAGPAVGQRVVITQGKKVIADTKTDKLGEFQVKKMRGGVYTVTAAKTTRQIRVWSREAAPKTAKKVALMVDSEKVVRGQGVIPLGLDAGTLLGLGVGLTGLGIGISNLDEIDDLESQVDRLQRSQSTN